MSIYKINMNRRNMKIIYERSKPRLLKSPITFRGYKNVITVTVPNAYCQSHKLHVWI